MCCYFVLILLVILCADILILFVVIVVTNIFVLDSNLGYKNSNQMYPIVILCATLVI